MNGARPTHRFRRLRLYSPVALLVGFFLAVALVVAPAHVFAQATPVMANHPLVGAWQLQTQTGNPSNPPSVAIFTSDGIYDESDANGSDGAGAWQPTGPNTANLTIIFHGTDEKGNYVAQIKVRASITVGASGNSFTAPYTLEFISPDGKSTGQLGPTTASSFPTPSFGTLAAPSSGVPHLGAADETKDA